MITSSLLGPTTSVTFIYPKETSSGAQIPLGTSVLSPKLCSNLKKYSGRLRLTSSENMTELLLTIKDIQNYLAFKVTSKFQPEELLNLIDLASKLGLLTLIAK